MIHETKGLSLEEVDELYEYVDNAWKSEGFVPSTKFRVENVKNTAAVGSGKKLSEDVPEAHHSSDHTEHTEVNGAATESTE
jgi:SP family sugar:H+ symporter-like MFS transporter